MLDARASISEGELHGDTYAAGSLPPCIFRLQYPRDWTTANQMISRSAKNQGVSC